MWKKDTLAKSNNFNNKLNKPRKKLILRKSQTDFIQTARTAVKAVAWLQVTKPLHKRAVMESQSHTHHPDQGPQVI